MKAIEATDDHFSRSINIIDDKYRLSVATTIRPQPFLTISQFEIGEIYTFEPGRQCWLNGGCWRPMATNGNLWMFLMVTRDIVETIGTGSCNCLSLPFMKGLVSQALQP